MFRKAMFALTALTVLSAAALTPTAASAKGWHHHHGWSNSFYVGGPAYVAYTGYSTCWVKRWVDTPFGPRLQRFNVCY